MITKPRLKVSANFFADEFYCKCPRNCGYNAVDFELLGVLQNVADHFDAAVTLTSGNRCPEHNRAVDGKEGSKHLRGIAADIQVKGVSPARVHKYLCSTYAGCYGIGSYNSFTHIDVRSDVRARW